MSPKWKNGIQNGVPVRAQFNIVITFNLPSPEVLRAQLMMDSLQNVSFDQKIFTVVEQMPDFPQGELGFYNYLSTNVQYPANAKKHHIEGKVTLSFIVERDGSISDVKVIKSISPEIDAEAIRLMNNCPKWNPGSQNGRPVRVAESIAIPIPLPQLK